MSNQVYPSSLPGLSIEVDKEPEFDTLVQRAVSGKELRIGQRVYPLWYLTLNYNFLRDTSVYNELKTLVGFFLSRKGAADSFLFSDPDDSAVVDQDFGVGDGTTTLFQLVREFGGFVEPVFNINGTPSLKITDWRGTWTPLATNRSNSLKYSEEFQQTSAWTQSGSISITADSTVAPDGTTTADTLTDSSAGANANVNQAVTIVSGTNYRTFSVYVLKTSGGTSKSLRLDIKYSGGTAVNSFAVFNTDTGAVITNTGASAGAVDAGLWWRFWVCEQNNGSGNTTCTVNIYPAIAAYGLSTADPTQTGSAVCWGAMLMVINGSPSDYIKTGSTAASSAPDYTINANGLVTFRYAPWATAVLEWTGSFYYRARFREDRLSATKFLHQVWKTGKVPLVASLQDKL